MPLDGMGGGENAAGGIALGGVRASPCAMRAEENPNLGALIRAPLTPAQEAEAIFQRKVIYEQLHPETKHGGDRVSSARKEQDDNLSFCSSTAQATGKDKRTIERAARRGKKLGADITAVIGTSLDKGAELDALAKMEPEERKPLIERARGRRATCRAALRVARSSPAHVGILCLRSILSNFAQKWPELTRARGDTFAQNCAKLNRLNFQPVTLMTGSPRRIRPYCFLMRRCSGGLAGQIIRRALAEGAGRPRVILSLLTMLTMTKTLAPKATVPTPACAASGKRRLPKFGPPLPLRNQCLTFRRSGVLPAISNARDRGCIGAGVFLLFRALLPQMFPGRMMLAASPRIKSVTPEYTPASSQRKIRSFSSSVSV